MTPSGHDAAAACQAMVRRHDYDRYLWSLFLPSDVRPRLHAILAFNLEIAKTREVVSEPLLGQIRLQWWREAVGEIFEALETGAPVRRHEVVEPLAQAVAEGGLAKEPLLAMIDGREMDLAETPPASLGTLLGYLDQTSAPVFRLAGDLLSLPATGARQAASIAAGRAWGLAGLLRAIPFHARQQRVYLPADQLGAAGLSSRHIVDFSAGDVGAAVVGALADTADAALAEVRDAVRAEPALRPALLPVALVPLYLRQLRRAGPAALTGEIDVSRFRRQVALWRASRRRRF